MWILIQEPRLTGDTDTQQILRKAQVVDIIYD